MSAIDPNQSIRFFDSQFQKQVVANEYVLNPFENAALPFMHGQVLDLGCGLGNLSIEAARNGATVVAVDASETAIRRIQATASAEKLKINAILTDVANYSIDRQFDIIVAIGLLMFFKREVAYKLLADIKAQTADKGSVIINVLIEGTTYMGMFDPDNYYLFGRHELDEQFNGWNILSLRHDTFDAPGNTKKQFLTIHAQKS